MPVSRLFWNEIYLDVERVPELASCRAAQELMQNRAFRTAARRLNTAALVDYPRAMALKRRVLERLSACCYGSPQRRVQLERWVRSRHSARGYARFRAAVEQTGRGWPEWGAQPPGALPRGIDPVVERYHLYVQWLLDEQLGAIAARHKAGHPAGLYLDLPLGVHRGGFDTWAHRNLFVGGMSCGAPPDRLFTGGQNWGFPPPHPERIRDEG